jgi:hypothetical protein
MADLAYIALLAGDPVDAQALNEAIDLARSAEDLRGEGWASGVLGLYESRLGDVSRGLTLQERAVAVARETGYRFREGFWLAQCGDQHALLGDQTEAENCYREAAAIASAINDRCRRAVSLCGLALLLLRDGAYAEARAAFADALALSRETGSGLITARCLLGQGMAAHAEGEADQALHHYREGLNLGMPGTEINALLVGVLLAAQGHPDQAHHMLALGLERATAAAERAPGYHDVLYRHAFALIANGDFESGGLALERALGSCSARGVRRDALFMLGLLGAEARKRFQSIVSDDSDSM